MVQRIKVLLSHKGYDPALELAGHVHPSADNHAALSFAEVEHLRRREQSKVDAIVSGQETGHYFLLMGPKGTGKSTMILEAMRAIEAEGVSICEAHPDLEVFRLRLGKSLNFEYNEDTQTVCIIASWEWAKSDDIFGRVFSRDVTHAKVC